MAFKTFAVASFAALVIGTMPAKANDNFDIFGFNKLFGTSSMGVTAGTSPIPRQMVAIDGKYKPGTIIIRTNERRLYYVTAPGQAIRYGV
ncbi:MAG: L,D-transpeptidase, partial [Xanthobacter sp. 17-67-6]